MAEDRLARWCRDVARAVRLYAVDDGVALPVCVGLHEGMVVASYAASGMIDLDHPDAAAEAALVEALMTLVGDADAS